MLAKPQPQAVEAGRSVDRPIDVRRRAAVALQGKAVRVLDMAEQEALEPRAELVRDLEQHVRVDAEAWIDGAGRGGTWRMGLKHADELWRDAGAGEDGADQRLAELPD